MKISRGDHIDWRDPDCYAPLIDADRSLFAWEWLRRSAEYRAAATLSVRHVAMKNSAAPFGLVKFEEPDLAVPHARPMWRSDICSQVLVAESGAQVRTDLELPLRPLRPLARFAAGEDYGHLLLSDGLRTIRVDAPLEAFARNLLSLSVSLDQLVGGELTLLTLRRLLALMKSGRFARSLHPREHSARRWVLQLRAHDALASGAELRQIAEELLGRRSNEPRWRSRDPSLRSQAQRLVRSARLLAAGGYRRILAGFGAPGC